MTVLTDRFVRQSYPGLNELEERLTRQYLRQSDGDVERLETQVRLGPGELLPDFRPDTFREAWRESSKFKVDLVVDRGSSIELVELKDFIRTSHLGQLLSYRYWFSVERSPDAPVRLVAVADDINPSAVQPGRFHNVSFHLTTQDGRDHFDAGLDAAPPFDRL